VARTLRIQWEAGQKVTARLVVPRPAKPMGILLAHGAGAGQDHPWMVAMRDLLAGEGFTTMTFNYAYTEAGRRAPDRAPKLLHVHRAAADRLAGYTDEVVLAGKSMGGRMASHLVGDDGWQARALVYLGYPLVPVGKSEPRSADHLRRIVQPQLFVSGTRDRLGPSDLIGPLAAELSGATHLPIPDGDHSLRVPKRAAKSNDAVLVDIAASINVWLSELPGR